MAKTIGDTNRDGLLQITDTRWDSNGTMYVTIREMIGQYWEQYGYDLERVTRQARALARATLPEYFKGQTRSSRVVRRWYANGQSHVTIAVSRNA